MPKKKENSERPAGEIQQLRDDVTAEVEQHHDTCRSLDATAQSIIDIMTAFPSRLLNAPALRLIMFGHIGALPYRDARRLAVLIRERFNP
jgi:hypothetical protein